MTLKNDAKFKEKLTCSFKYDIRNLVNFYPATQKSENLHFDALLMFKAYKDLDERNTKELFSQHGTVMQKLNKP